MPTALEKKLVEVLERQTEAMESIAEYSENVQTALKDLNEKFIFHQESTTACIEKVTTAVESQGMVLNGIRQDFTAIVYPLLKWFAVALIVLAGGAEALRFVG